MRKFFIALTVIVTGVAIHCQGVIPANDHFVTRIPLVGTNFSITGSNVDATKEIDEPDPSFQAEKSVWWTWTAPVSGYLTLSTAGSTFDTMLTVCTGTTVSNLTVVAFNDVETNTSAVSFNVVAGVTYQIAVDGAGGARGSIALALTLGATQSLPANDNFANRIPLTGSHLSNVDGSNLGATAEPGEPFHADSIGLKSVWWSWTAPESGGVTLKSQGSSIDTVMAVYTGNSIANLTLVAGNDEDPLSPFGFESRVTFNAISNVTYQIAIDGYEGDAGDIRFDVDLGAAASVPSNDNFANRKGIAGNNINTNGSNVGATFEAAEPMHMLTFGGKSVWFSWTAPSSGGVSLTASNDSLDTIVAVYRGTSLANLVFVAGNDEDFLTAVEGDSTTYFNATNGTTYQIAVDGYDGVSGNFSLRLVLGSADAAPANDNFANRVLVSGNDVSRSVSTIGASFEIGEPLHRGYYGGKSAWWRWTSPGPGFVTVDTIGSLSDTLLGVYTGTALSNLVEIASDDESGGNFTSLVNFPTRSNVTYQIAVDGYDGDGYDINMRVRFTQASYSLTVITNPAGAGSVTINPLPDQGVTYAPGSVVTLTANPAAGSVFTGWTGSMSSTNNPLTFLMNSNKTLTAGFFVVPTTKVWTGASNPSGNWSVSQNWGGSLPVAGDQLIFPPGAARLASNTNDFPANTVFKSIVLGGADYILRGNAITLTNGVVSTNTSGTNTIALDLQVSADQTFRCNNAAAQLVVSGNLSLGNRTVTAETVGNLILSGIVSGNGGGIIKTNTGTLSLLGANPNTFSGSTVVNQGTVVLGKSGVAIPGALVIGDGVGTDVVRFDAASQLASSSAVTINSSGLLDLNDFSGSIGQITFAGGTIDSGTGTLGLNAGVTANTSATTANILGKLSLQGATRTFSIAAGASSIDLSISAAIADGGGSAGLIKSGVGGLQLSGSNTYVGSTTINQGLLSLANSTALGGTNQGTILNSNAILSVNGIISGEVLTLAGGTMRSDTGSNLWQGNLVLTNSSVASISTNAALNLAGIISGAGSITKSGPGTLIFSGATGNSYGGLTTVNQGLLILSKTTSNAVPGPLVIGDGTGGSDADVVRLGGTQQISLNAQVTLNNSGLLDLTTFTDAIGSLSGSGHVGFSGAAGNLSVGHNNNSTTFSGLITGPGGLGKGGGGTLTLSATNTFTGPTSIGEGVLRVNGTQSGTSVSIGPLGTLSGTGRVGQIFGAGLISPGSSPGILAASNLTLSSNMTYRVELNGLNPGSAYDRLTITGTVTLAGTLDASVSFAPVTGDTFIIIENDGNDAISGAFAGLPQGSILSLGGVLLQVSYTGGAGSNDVTLTRVSPSVPTVGSITAAWDGSLQLMGSGTPGITYVLEAAFTLDPPILWIPISTNTADTNGFYQFTDADAPLNPTRYYRVRWP